MTRPRASTGRSRGNEHAGGPFDIETMAGGVTAPAGFRVAATACGIKPAGLDLALLTADRPATAAGLFTSNLVKAAPVLVSQEHLARSGGLARAILVNSGCANACTGEPGLGVARASAAEAARLLGCPVEQVLVASTGVIGVALDGEKIRTGLQRVVPRLDRAGHHDAAVAILTTDRGPKEHAVRVSAPAGRGRSSTFVIGGMCKGAGMIHPNLATMLAFLTTDVRTPSHVLARALRTAASSTFNAITVDGDTSTNDTVLLLASGAGRSVIDQDEGEAYRALVGGLEAVCQRLAIELVRGAEGATKLVALRVAGARSDGEAMQVARTVANSLLVKTAIHGGDPNWGRLIAAMGRAGVGFDPARARVAIGGIVLYDRGVPFDHRAADAARHLAGADIAIDLDLGSAGPGTATAYTCDLSAEYVRINADYRT